MLRPTSSPGPDDDCSTRTEVPGILDWHALRSRVDFECLNVKGIDEVVEREIPPTSHTAGPQERSIENDAGLAFPAHEHGRCRSHRDVTAARSRAGDAQDRKSTRL